MDVKIIGDLTIRGTLVLAAGATLTVTGSLTVKEA